MRAELGEEKWLEALVFVDVENRGQASHTIGRLTPGILYAFPVASNDGLYGAPGWSQWAQLTLSGTLPAGPATGPTTSPGQRRRPLFRYPYPIGYWEERPSLPPRVAWC